MKYLWLVLLAGCASESLTEYERIDRYNRTVTDYAICLQAAEDQGIPWVIIVRGPRSRNAPPSYLEMKEQMSFNGCHIRWD